MVEATVEKRLLKSGGCLHTIFEYVGTKPSIKFQLANKDFYNRIMPRVNIRISMPAVNLVFES